MKKLDEPTLTDAEKKVILTDVALVSNFMQKYKMLLWEACSDRMVDVDGIKRPLLPPEATLNKLAMELYDWAKLKE